jgi:hypothetical protein
MRSQHLSLILLLISIAAWPLPGRKADGAVIRGAEIGDTIVVNNVVVHKINTRLTALELPGDDITYDTRANRISGTTEPRSAAADQVVKVAGVVRHTFKAGTSTHLALPGKDILFTVPAAVTPTTQPATQPTTAPTAPVADIVVKPGGESLTAAVLRSTGGTLEKPKTILVKAGEYTGTVRIGRGIKNVHIIGERLAKADGSFSYPTYRGTSAQDYGLDMLWEGVGPQNVKISGIAWKGYAGGHRIQHLRMQSAPLNEWARNIEIVDCKFLDMSSRELKHGHGGFTMNVDGYHLHTCHISGAGWAKAPSWQIWAHGHYGQAPMKNVRIHNNLYDRCESFAIMARGPLVSDTQADNGDPGPSVVGNVLLGSCTGIMVNGPRAEVTDNVFQVAHYHTGPGDSDHGRGMIWAYVGELKLERNVRVNTPHPTNVGYTMPFWTNNSGRRVDGWEWTKATRTTVLDNWDRFKLEPSFKPDLSDLPRRSRAGEPVGKLTVEAQTRARKAA